MRIGRTARIGVFCLASAVLFGGAAIYGCNVGGDSNDNIQPTDPSPNNTPPQRGDLAISPTEYNLSAPTGSDPGGVEQLFRVLGGSPPYVWSNSSEMGYLVPIDEFGQGYYSAAMYRFRHHPDVSGDDTVMVRDGNGSSVTAKVTLTYTGSDATPPPTPTAPTISATPNPVVAGSDVTLVASGGDGTSYAWQQSSFTSSLSSTTGKTVTLTTGCNTVTYNITVTVTSAGLDGTETITVSPAAVCP